MQMTSNHQDDHQLDSHDPYDYTDSYVASGVTGALVLIALLLMRVSAEFHRPPLNLAASVNAFMIGAQILPVLLLTFAVERAFFEAGSNGIRTRAAVISFLCVIVAAAVGETGGLVAIGLHHPSASIREWLQIPIGTAIAGAVALVVGHAAVGSGMRGTLRALASADEALQTRRLLSAEHGRREADVEIELQDLETWFSDPEVRKHCGPPQGEEVRVWGARQPRRYLDAQAAMHEAERKTDDNSYEIPLRIAGAVLLVSAIVGAVASPTFRPLGTGIAIAVSILLLFASERRRRLAAWLRQSPEDLEALLQPEEGADPEGRG